MSWRRSLVCGLVVAHQLPIGQVASLRCTLRSNFHSGIHRTPKLVTPEYQQLRRMASIVENANVLLQDWSKYEFGLPPFAEAKPSDFEIALTESMKMHIDEVRAIANNPDAPTFENTIAAYDRSGAMYQQVSNMFDNLCSSNGVPELQAVELKMAGPIAAHYNQLSTMPGLFDRINAVHEKRHDSGLNREQIRLVERFHLDFVRAGAKFSAEDQAKYAKITEKLAELCTVFTQNLLADESDITVKLHGADDLAGLPADLVAAAQQAATDRGICYGVHVITLSRSLVEPFITYSERRDLREKAWKLWTSRGELEPSRDNLKVAREILALRVQQAQMHGYKNYAEYATADTMAGTPARVMDLLERVWGPAKLSIDRERAELVQYILHNSPGMVPESNVGGLNIAPWDWRYYAEKVRQKTYNLDESEVKPYFPLDRMCEAIFDCAFLLFGLKFKLRPDLVSYHPDVQTYEVRQCSPGQDASEGKLVAIFLHDNYARPHKKSGAWMSEYRTQCRNADGTGANVIPIIVNNNNFNKPGPGESCLLSFDDARTLFHEFGHGLHGMLSDVTYRRLAGTSVLRDFVELPSQLYEHWLSEPTVLQKHARHYQTGEPIPQALLERMFKANKFGQGFATIEYAACVLVDVALHQLTDVEGLDITAFEQQELGRLGMPQGIVMRHRPAHFAHLFAGSGYASAYYVYLWAEVLDADGFDAFKEAGNCFDPAVAQRVRQYVYSAGNSRDPAEAYRLFRGRDPAIEPMLKKKGLL